jgi:hypothetical protein
MNTKFKIANSLEADAIADRVKGTKLGQPAGQAAQRRATEAAQMDGAAIEAFHETLGDYIRRVDNSLYASVFAGPGRLPCLNAHQISITDDGGDSSFTRSPRRRGRAA